MRAVDRLWTDYRSSGIIGSGGGPNLPPPSHLGPDIRNWLIQSGDQIVTVPDGTYTAGPITLNRAATAGVYGGWLVLVAQNQGGAVIDLSPPGTDLGGGLTANGDLVFENGRARVLMVGFKFQNGRVMTATYPYSSANGGSFAHLGLWHCEATFPATTWAAENANPDLRYHDAPRIIDPRYGSNHVSLYGCTIHDTATAVFPRAGSSFLTFVGLDIYNLDDGGASLDPHDIVHPDGIGMVGGNYHDITITDCYIHPGSGSGYNTGIIIQDAGGQTSSVTLARLWVAHGGALGGGINIVSDHSYGPPSIGGTMNDVHTWDNGYFELNEVVDGFYSSTPNWSPNRINFTGSGNTFGIAQTGTDPATAWRTANPLSSWSTGFPWT